MNERKIVFLLILIMVIATLIVTSTTITMLYRTAFNQEQERLVEIVQSQAHLIEAIALFDANHHNLPGFPENARAATLNQIMNAYQNYAHTFKTTHFDIACLKGENIVFLCKKGFDNHHQSPLTVPLDSKVAEPMREALSGSSGIMTGLDHQGQTVVAAYKHVTALNIGIVAKIELSKIRAPFIKTGATTGFIVILVIVAGTLLIVGVSNPLIKVLIKTNNRLNREIEERKRIERELINREESYRSIFENSGAASIIMEDDKTICMANPKFEQLTGYTRQEIEGKMKWPELVPDDCLELMLTYHSERRKPGGNVPTEYECRIIDKEGHIKDILIKIGMIPGTEKSIGSYMDITKRKQNEDTLRKYKRIVDTANDHLALLDMNYVYQMVNSAYSRTFNKTEAEIIGHCVAEFHNDTTYKTMIEPNLDKCLAGEIVRYQRRFRDHDSGERWMDVALYPYTEKDHSIQGVVIAVRDITEIKLTEDKLATSLKDKEILLRELYHRTKNNIQVIKSLIMLQSAYLEDRKALEIFRDINSHIQAMSLVHEKLYQSRNLSRLDLKDYIEDLANGLLLSYPDVFNKISLSVTADSVPVLIDTAIPCGLVINELMSNSLKHAFPDSESGEIRIGLHSADNGEIDLKIGDNGIGLPEGFDLRETNTLGLQLVIGLIEDQLRGTVEWSIARGTKFHIRFKETYRERISSVIDG